MAIPKVACTTVKVTLHHLAGNPIPEDQSEIHNFDVGLRLWDFSVEEIAEMFSSPEWVKFCLVRNPYDRLFSAYKSKIGNTSDTQYGWLRDAIRQTYKYPIRDGRPATMVTFRDFVQYLVNADAQVRYLLKPDGIFDAHYNVQSHILMQYLIGSGDLDEKKSVFVS